MKIPGLAVAVLFGLLGFAAAPSPSFSQGVAPLLADYDQTKTLTRTGPITALTWANTHCVLFFDAKNDDGSTTNWAIELTNPRNLIALHLIPPVLLPGTPVTVSFSPATDYPNRGLVKTLSMSGKVVLDASRIQADIDDQYTQPAKKPAKKSAPKQQ